MIEHTSDKSHYAIPIGRTVLFMARPERTRQKAYREPVLVKKKRFRSKLDAMTAKMQWEGKLV